MREASGQAQLTTFLLQQRHCCAALKDNGRRIWGQRAGEQAWPWEASASRHSKAPTLPFGHVLVIPGVSTGIRSGDEFLQNKYFLKQSHIILIWFKPEMPPNGSCTKAW